MVIVADSSALIALATCDALFVLDALSSRVRVPLAVAEEVSVRGKPQALRLRLYVEDKITPVRAPHSRKESGLGRGEIAAMALCEQVQADVLLVDDSRARNAAQQRNITVVGSLGLLVRAKEKGVVDRLAPFMDRLRRSDLYISEALIEDVLRQVGEQ
ncbi:MAG: DUF3368 domain-containing protein [Bacteroidetes bacterium]|nr:DUF3368 domain-containing protein [Bacteroidota bacterium]